MAPESVLAGHRLLLVIYVLFVLAVPFVSLLVQPVNSPRVYERDFLLSLRESAVVVSSCYSGENTFCDSPFIARAAVDLCALSDCCRKRRKRNRRRGKRGGLSVRRRRASALAAGPDRLVGLSADHINSARASSCQQDINSSCASSCQLDARFSYLVMVVPQNCELSTSIKVSRRRVEKRGANLDNLRCLEYVPSLQKRRESPDTTVKMALFNVRAISNKTFLISDLISSRDLDFFLMTETWLSDYNRDSLAEATPRDYNCLNSPRPGGRGGGIATIFKNCFKCRLLTVDKFASFEVQAFIVALIRPVICALIYRPPNYNKDFIGEFSEFLSSMITCCDSLIILGDFNIHICCPEKPLVQDFLLLLDSFNLMQSVDGATHKQGHTLDLVLSRGVPVGELTIENMGLSDHFVIMFNVTFVGLRSDPVPVGRRVRTINAASASKFSDQYKALIPVIKNNPSTQGIEELVSDFNMGCNHILDSIAPWKQVKSKTVSQPWLNVDSRVLRQKWRQAERRWKKDRLQVSYEILRECMVSYQQFVKAAKAQHFSHLIAKNQHNPKILFSVINTIIHPVCPTVFVNSERACESFLQFFTDKIAAIRASISSGIQAHSQVHLFPDSLTFGQLSVFEPVTTSDLFEIAKHLKPAYCSLDIIPPRLLIQVWDAVGPTISAVVNQSLVEGQVPSYFKDARVQPLLKKTSLDQETLNNYRPISKVPFLAKMLEKVVLNQLSTFLNNNNIFDKFQSGFRPQHSTETALLKVTNDLLLSVDSGNCAALVLLDLSAAFDTVDHGILLERLRLWVGIRGIALSWFTSYLQGRTFVVEIGNSISSTRSITSGVPQGSCLGPVLFSLYMLPLGLICQRHGVAYHCYADDTQLYLPLKLNDISKWSALLDCLNEIKLWMASNFLQLNESKFEVLILGPPKSGNQIALDLGPLASNVNTQVRNLGVIFDSEMKFDKQVNAVVKGSFFQLRGIAKLKGVLSSKDMEAVIHAFITSRLDYCNSLYLGLPKKLLSRLQLVQNAAARLLTGTRKWSSISPVLASLHWLPVEYRVQFKVLLMVFKGLHGLVPVYISSLLQQHVATRPLRSSQSFTLNVPRARLKTKGDRAFEVAAPRLWNTLPLYIRSCDSIEGFKSRLKTYLFSAAFNCS